MIKMPSSLRTMKKHLHFAAIFLVFLPLKKTLNSEINLIDPAPSSSVIGFD